MIELTDITKIYPMGAGEVRAVDGVSLTIGAGEFVAIMGSSGSGKSTMMHLLGCLDRPTSGRYALDGQTVSTLNDRQLARIRNRSVGFVFQTFNLISRMSAWENVAVPLYYARQSGAKAQALTALGRVGLADRAKHQPNELSGGERQRVAIARAIINQPRLILADEPTGNLDTQTGSQIMAIFRDLHAAGTTIIVVTHESHIAEQASRIVTMRDGKIVQDRITDARPVEPTGPPPAVEAITVPAPSGAAVAEPASVADAGPPASVRSDPPGAAASASMPAELPTFAAVTVHPNAKRALNWALLGPGCLIGLLAWAQVLRVWQATNPTFVSTFGRAVQLMLLVLIFIAPVVAFFQGRKGARWVRLAPARFTGLRRALVAQWVAGIYLLIMTSLVGLLIAVVWIRVQMGAGR